MQILANYYYLIIVGLSLLSLLAIALNRYVSLFISSIGIFFSINIDTIFWNVKNIYYQYFIHPDNLFYYILPLAIFISILGISTLIKIIEIKEDYL
jgi:hypothetical protein